MTTGSRETPALRAPRRRLSTRHLGAFVAAASSPVAAMMMAPGAARASVVKQTAFVGCLSAHADGWGYWREPNWMLASASAKSYCGGGLNKGWVEAIVHSQGSSFLRTANGLGYAKTNRQYIYKNYYVDAGCENTGNNKHEYLCFSSRSY
jgi:hypothetical protein